MSWPTCAKPTVPLPSPVSSARANTALGRVRSVNSAARLPRPSVLVWRLGLEGHLITALEFQDVSGFVAGGDLEAQPRDDLAYLRDLLGVAAGELAGTDP